MIKKILILYFLFVFLSAESQNWDSLPSGTFNNVAEFVMCDSVHNELIVSGNFANTVGNLKIRGVGRWNGVKWDSMAGGINTHDIVNNPNAPNGRVMSCIPYNGKLLVGGQFSSIGGVNATSLALWDGVKWDSLPKRAFGFNNPVQINGFYKKNNLLYLYGTFDMIAGQAATGLATWDGTNFTPVILPVSSFIGISGIIEYQNVLYVSGGHFNVAAGNLGDVLKFDGVNWVSTTNGGLRGFNGGVGSMVIYNNELYVGGHFLIADGNPGENIMKWDGSQWHDVGYGGEQVGSVKKLLVYHNKLWSIGQYGTAAHMPAFGISVYDGVTWCSLKDTLDNVLLSGTTFRDTIYVAGAFNDAGGDPNIKSVAKLKNPNLYRQCQAVGINDLSKSFIEVKIHPNPVSSILHIETEQNDFENSSIEVTNVLGQEVLKQSYSNTVEVSSLAQGYYNLKITTSNKQAYYSKFLKE